MKITGASRPGTLAYSSWLTMQRVGETNKNACNFNDFAIVKIAAVDVAKVNPSVPHWGGPKGLNTTGNPLFSRLYTYGNSSLRLGLRVLAPKTGVSLGTTGGGWTHPSYTVSPGIPGDSGSALLDAQGRASGVLSTLSIAPTAGSNNFSDLNRALSYARSNSSFTGLALENGTVAFDGSKLPLGV